ncbi:MAG: hypothetical protein MK210_05580 [Dehalococcoidia bacterium]|jgi:hypothetical protein|nr:hypothetical protein [Dehalococcoidia bacterium]
MATLTLKNTWKNLTLVAAGALMATLIAVPLGGIASADVDPNDDLPYIAPIEAPTYTIEGSNGLKATFELIDRDGQLMLVLLTDETVFVAPEDDE